MIIPSYPLQLPDHTYPGPGETDPAQPHIEYVSLRSLFKALPEVTDVDGLPTFIAKADPGRLHTFRPFDWWDYHPVESPDGIKIDGHVIDLAGANDAFANVDEWHWWISDPARASGSPGRWRLYRNDPTPGVVTRSGRVTLRMSEAALAQTLSGGVSAEDMSCALNGVSIYALRLSDRHVGWADLYRCAFAPESFPAEWPTY